jgi:hypothetical protein
VFGYNQPGKHIDTLVAASGCDSIRDLRLNIVTTMLEIQNVTICIGETYGDYSESGDYQDTLASGAGCDSLITILSLDVTPLPSFTIDTTICEGDDLFGFNTPGVYNIIIENDDGCDTLIELNMNVLPLPDCLTYTEEEDFLESKLFPNPATEFVTVKSSQLIVSINIYNTEGQLIGNIISLKAQEYKLNLESYKNGLYFVKVTSENGSYLHRFLKL